jgi:spoIIIJ-associated protein
MTSLEIEGKTVDEAIKAACDQLNVPREKLEIEILQVGSAGIFGIMGARKAKIRATLREESPAAVPMGKEEITAMEGGEAPTTEKGEAPDLDEIRALTQGILDRMGLETSVTVKQEKDTVHVRVEGEKSGLLIGRRGQTLEALQYLLTLMVNRKGSGKVRLLLDSGGYRNRRKEYLEKLALRMGAKAKQTGKPVVINPLNAHDRRIVHLALEKDKTLKTVSRGEGPMKKIVIFENKKDTAPESLPTGEG